MSFTSRRLGRAAVLLSATLSAAIAHAGDIAVRKCDFQVTARCASGDASVTLVDGKLQSIAVNIDWCGLKDGPHYACTIDASRDDKGSTWSEEGGATTIDNTEPFNKAKPDRVKVMVGQQVSIDLEQAQSLGRCGAGAELPRAIVIPSRKGKCRVSMKEP